MIFYYQILFLLCVFLFCCAEDQFEDECGLEATDSTPLLKGSLGGVKANQFPWHVAIFHRKKDNQLEQICGGSLVRSNLVISGAHCFSVGAHNHQVHLADYRVVGGIRLSYWNSSEIGRQESEVLEVRLREEYGGHIQHFEYDIAIVQLMTMFTFSDTVRAVCLNLADADLNTRQTSPGSIGKIAGWGLTESDNPSDTLNFLGVPVVGRVECIEKLPSNFRSFFTSDKICAGFTNESVVCPGDSGGGLVFPQQNASTGLQRWYLCGVLSNAPFDPKKLCRTNVFALYTNVFKHQKWLSAKMASILPRGGGCRVKGSVGVCRNFSDCPVARQDILRGIQPKYCSPPGPEVCCEETCPPLPPSIVSQRKTGSKASNYCVDLAEKLYPCQQKGSSWSRGDLCGSQPDQRELAYTIAPIFKATSTEVQRYALLKPEPNFREIQGFLVSERWLFISATSLNVLLIPWYGNNFTSPPEVVFSISRTVVHPQRTTVNTYGHINNIALLEMDKPVTFSERFRPVCLHTQQDTLRSLNLTRWDQYNETSQPADLLSQEKCRTEIPPDSYVAPGGVTDEHMCVTFPSGCEPNHWGYEVYLTASNRHRVACTELLVGTFLRCQNKDENNIQLYLRVAHYVAWIESVVWP